MKFVRPRFVRGSGDWILGKCLPGKEQVATKVCISFLAYRVYPLFLSLFLPLPAFDETRNNQAISAKRKIGAKMV